MDIAARIDNSKYTVLRWRYELSIPKKLVLAVGMACMVGLLAQFRLPLPFSPVPVTGQTLAVLLAGVLLGRRWGAISMAIYVGLGVAGVPWFNGWGSGLGYLAGPTGGYLIGFVLAALFLGRFADPYLRKRGLPATLGLMIIANFVLIYIPGLIQLNLWLNLVKGEAVGLATLLGMGAVPFIIGDVAKVILAAAVTRGIAPRQREVSPLDAGEGNG